MARDWLLVDKKIIRSIEILFVRSYVQYVLQQKRSVGQVAKRQILVEYINLER